MLGKHFSGRCRRREVAVVKRFKKESMYGLSAKKSGRCGEVAVNNGGVRQYNFKMVSNSKKLTPQH